MSIASKTVLSVIALLFIAGEVHAAESANGAEFRDPTTGMELVFVKGGCYQMGDAVGDGKPNERPAHEVCVDDFYIGKHEVTVSEFKKFANDTGYITEAEKGGGCYLRTGNVWKKDKSKNWRNPGLHQDDRHPAVCIAWNDAVAFTEWLGKKTGKTFRLPTEAEWEYAARSAGKKEKWAGTNSESELEDYAWYNKNSGSKTHPVGLKKPNPFGLYDMSGNACEWVQDWFGEDYYSNSPRNNPPGRSSGWAHVIRGGAWYDSAAGVRGSGRDVLEPGSSGDGLSFRVAMPK